MTAQVTRLANPGFAIHIERVEPRFDPELESVRAVLDSAARRLAAAGIEQWPMSFTEDGGRRMVALREFAERGEVYLMRYYGQPAATVTLSRWADPDFASGWPQCHDALYLYRLAASDLTRRTDLRFGTWIVQQFAPYQAYQLGRRYVRLDCSRTNTALHDYYLARGFERIGTVEVPGRKSGALFQLDTWDFTPIPFLRLQS
jgi:hypothetical protein